MKKINIVLVSHGFQANYERGFANGLVGSNVDIALLSSDTTDYNGLSDNIKCINLRGSQRSDRHISTKIFNILIYNFRLLLYFKKNKSSIYHVIGLIHPPIIYGIVWGLIYRIFCNKYLLTVHDLLPHDRHTFLNKFFYKISFNLPNYLVVHTNLMAFQLVEKFHIPLKKIIVMEHGIEPFIIDSKLNNKLTNEPIKLLFFGRILRYKGLDLLLDVVEKLSNNVELLIAGTCIDATLKAELELKILNHPKRESIVWRNEFIPENELPKIFINADVLVLPYRHIDQSGVLFQALRYGLPIIATSVGSFSDYVTKDVGEICLPDDLDDMHQKLDILLNRLKSISREKIQQKAKKFEWGITVEVLIKAYNELGLH